MTDTVNPQTWNWYYSGDEVIWYGCFENRDDAIRDGRAEYPGEPFLICEALEGSLRRHMPDADSIYDMLLENADNADQWGADGPPTGRMPSAARESLNVLLTAWFDKHEADLPKPWAFAETRHEETIEPLEGEEGK